MPTSLRGDQALAYGAMRAGVRVVTGYPGSPATGVFEAFVRQAQQAGRHVAANWAPNEKVALELAYGASLGGQRALVVLKSVGLNVALDPLATMALSGCDAGLVILVGDDPGGLASTNEQDSRWLARVAEVPIVEVAEVAAAAALLVQAYAWSESAGTPLIVRCVRALAQATAPADEPWELPPFQRGYDARRGRWVVRPSTVTRQRHSQHRRLRVVAEQLEASPYDRAQGAGSSGVLAAGYTWSKLQTLLPQGGAGLHIAGLASAWPLPEARLARWLRGLERALVLEEGSPFVEQQLRALAQREGIALAIHGREDRWLPAEGELTPAILAEALASFSAALLAAPEQATGSFPSEQPLCPDCPYRPVFDALQRAMDLRGGRDRHLLVGEAGCMVRACLPPYELFDGKYSLGSALGLASGLALAQHKRRVVAVVGDSSFFHSDMNALPHALQLGLPLTALVLDNQATGFTGGQAHPGTMRDEQGAPRAAVSIARVCEALGAAVSECETDDAAGLEAALQRALEAETLTVVVVHGPCPRYAPLEKD